MLEDVADRRVLKRGHTVLCDGNEFVPSVSECQRETVLRGVTPNNLVCKTARDDHIHGNVWEISPILEGDPVRVGSGVKEHHVSHDVLVHCTTNVSPVR